MNLGGLLDKLTFRTRDRGRDYAGSAKDEHLRDYTDETAAARTQHGLYGAGGAPPGYVHEYDEGRPKK